MQLCRSIVKERPINFDAPGSYTRAALANISFEKRLAKLAKEKARNDAYRKSKMQNQKGDSLCSN